MDLYYSTSLHKQGCSVVKPVSALVPSMTLQTVYCSIATITTL